MFTTKKQVDQHVKTSLAKLRTENEKRLRGLVIAKMYFKIGEYASAQHYVSGYLAANEAAAQAHRLLGDCYVKLKQHEKALPSYQRSFQLDNKQTDLLIDACNLILAGDVQALKASAKFWCEAAGNARIQHESVFNLKLKMLAGDGDNKDTKHVEEMIVKEINNRPSEVSPRLQLVNYYISKNRGEDAFKYVVDLMTRHPAHFLNSLEWYAVVHKALKQYRQSTDVVLAKNWDYWLLLLTSLDRQLSLALAQDHNLSSQQSAHLLHCQGLLFELDQTLYTAANISFPVRSELSSQLINHFQGQFLLHAATFLYKRERTLSGNQWWTTVNNTLPLLFIAFRLGIASTEDSWLKQANETTRDLVRLWQRQGAFRCSQAGRTLLSCIQREDNQVAPFKTAEELTDAARKQCVTKNWTTTMFRNLFATDEQVNKTGTSFLVTSNLLAEPHFEMPSALRLQMHERMAEALQSDSLPQLVYLYLHNEKLSECDFNVFSGIDLTTSNIFNCSAATLNKLDIETFLVATVMQTRSRLEAEAKMTDGPRPSTLPFANMARSLCTEEQIRWWQAAHNITQGLSTDETWNVREVLQDGLEAVRCVGTPKMDLVIALLTGDVLKQKTDNNLAIDLTTKKAYEQRVENIFQCALHLYKNQSTATVVDKRRLFQCHNKKNVVGTEECDALLEGAIIFLAELHFRNGDFETCIEALTNVQLPYATYYIAEAYKKMDESHRNNKTPPRSGCYQSKVKQYLGQTQKLLASASKKSHSLRTVVSNELKKLQYSNDANVSGVSIDEDLNLSYPNMTMNRSSRQESQVVDQVSALTALVTQLTMQNTMLQTEMSDIKKMLREQKEAAATTATPPPNLSESMYRLEQEQQRLSSAFHHSPHFDYMGGRYSMGGFPAYQGMPFQGGAPQYPGAPHLRGPPAMYGQDPNALAMGNVSLGVMPTYDPMTGTVVVSPMHHGGGAGGGQGHGQGGGYYGAASIPAPVAPPPQQSVLSAQLQQPPIPLASSSTVDQTFGGNSILKTWNSTYNNEPVEKGAPANVVITSSDPVPSMHNTVTPQKLLSVTIPPQHIKNFGQAAGGGAAVVNKQANDSSQFPTVLSGSFNNHSSTLSHTATNISGDETATEEDYYDQGAEYSGYDEAEESVSEPPAPAPVVAVAPPPVVIEKVAPEVKKEAVKFSFGPTSGATSETAKPSPFSSFTFGGGATTTASPEKPFSSLFGNIPKPTTTSPEKPFGSLFGSAGAVTKPLFGFSSTPSATATNTPAKDAGGFGAAAAATEASPSGQAAEEGEDDYVPTAQFKPVIELPSLIEVKTGEEDEDVLFEHRAKLLRFDTTTKEWKERGLGNIRIMVRKDDSSQVRLLMRREQVLKLACNQRVTKDQEFKKMPNSETALSWYAQDFAENELKTELFAIRFKTSDICKNFHDAIKEAQRNMKEKDEGKAAEKPAAAAAAPEDKGEKKGFGDMFKKQVGSWECGGCLIVNKADALYCVACDSPKDDTVPKKEEKPKGLDLSGVKPGQFTFGFGVKPATEAPQNLSTKVAPPAAPTPTPVKPAEEPVKGFGDAFKPKVGSWECQACYITNKGEDSQCVSCATSKDGTTAAAPAPSMGGGLSFGAVAASGGGFNFGMAKPTFSFGVPPATNTTESTPAPAPSGLFGLPAPATTTTNGGLSFGLDSKQTFDFVFKPKSPGKMKSPQKPLTNGGAGGEDEAAGSDEENIEEENTAYFTPVIPLPEKVEAKTGEEEEEVLYSHRAKLFRFTAGEWKERGLGDVKILKHKMTGKLRVVMRREQVLKICLNHVLDEAVEYQVKDNKSWHFVANDFSEGVLELMQFSLRFKTPEIATEFKEAADAARKDAGMVTGTADDTVEEADVSGVSEEEQKLIKELKLPANFFSYKEAENCPGCPGCDDEQFDFGVWATGEVKDEELPLKMPALPKVAVKSVDVAKNLFGDFNKSLTTTTSPSANLFGGATMFSGTPTKPASGPVFGGSTFGQTQPVFGAAAAKPLFSGFGSAGTGSVFGSSTAFGATATQPNTTTTPSLFGTAIAPPAGVVEPAKTTTSVFGQNSSFGSSTTSTLGSFNFGTAAQSLSFDKPKEETPPSAAPKTEEPKAENIFKMDSNFSFASLAQQQEPSSLFAAKKEAPAGGFFGLSNTNDFKHFSNPANGNGEAADESAEDPNYDPHYEPIIALPEEISVSTGEEEETKLFGERGCLYRFDATNKEWKERGVGEFKILHHPGKGTYRFVMRREQIFKLVLNHAISAEFDFKPMNKSGKSYCWAAMNHAESEGQLEQLAVRFKNTDIAARFEETVKNCISNLQD